MWVMEERFWRAALALALVLCAFFPATDAEPDACHRPSAGDLILGSSATCFPSDPPTAGTGFEGVFEGNEITLQRAIGVKPAEAISDKTISVTNLIKDIWGDKQEDCPSSWVRSAENLLQQDAYLAFASSFVLLRLLYFLLPKLSSCIKRAWGRQLKFPSLICLCEYSQAFLEQVMIGFSRLNPGKRANLQEGAMNAKEWVSKSLVSVSVGEPSSGRVSPHH